MPRAKESRPNNTSKKRNAANSPALPSNKRKKSKRRFFPLLEFPPEVLDNILSYVIRIPWNPSSATYPGRALKLLFPPSVLQTNRFLRRRSLNLIAHKCLWVRVDFLSRLIWDCFEGLESVLPNLPPIYQEILPSDLAGIRFVLGEPGTSLRRTRSLNKDTTSFLFPFNYHSFGILFGRMLNTKSRLDYTKIELSTLPSYMRRIVELQILPTIPILRAWSDVSVREPTGRMVEFRRDDSLIDDTTGLIQTFMSTIQALDAEDCPLEGSILCMYCGHLITWGALWSRSVSPFLHWIDGGGGIAASDWLENPSNLKRMRAVRTLFYIESRAFYTYLAGTDQYGHEFAMLHYNDITRLTLGWTKHRWIDLPDNMWFGLPDHEVATMYHVQALAFKLNYKYLGALLEHDPKNPLVRELIETGRSAGFLEAIYFALRAWNLDTNNLEYAATLNRMAQREPDLVDELREFISENEDMLLEELRSDTQPDDDKEKWRRRAQQLAWSANVAYDQRQEADMPSRRIGGPGLDSIKQLLGDESSKRVISRNRRRSKPWTILRFELFDLDSEDMENAHTSYHHADIAPWHCWTPMRARDRSSTGVGSHDSPAIPGI